MTRNNPHWWSDDHESAWERVRSALKGEWMLPSGPEVGGPEAWAHHEAAAKLGFGARRHYVGDPEWTPRLESVLARDWDSLGTGHSWDSVRDLVMRGWALAGDPTETPDRATH